MDKLKSKVRLVAFVAGQLKADLKEIADKENRSLSGLVGFVLSKYVEDWQRANK